VHSDSPAKHKRNLKTHSNGTRARQNARLKLNRRTKHLDPVGTSIPHPLDAAARSRHNLMVGKVHDPVAVLLIVNQVANAPVKEIKCQ